MSVVTEILAYGVRGSVKGKKFTALVAKDGRYHLHSEVLARSLGVPLNCAATKVYAWTLDEAAALVRSGGFHLRVTNRETGQTNKRKASELTIVEK